MAASQNLPTSSIYFRDATPRSVPGLNNPKAHTLLHASPGKNIASHGACISLSCLFSFGRRRVYFFLPVQRLACLFWHCNFSLLACLYWSSFLHAYQGNVYTWRLRRLQAKRSAPLQPKRQHQPPQLTTTRVPEAPRKLGSAVWQLAHTTPGPLNSKLPGFLEASNLATWSCFVDDRFRHIVTKRWGHLLTPETPEISLRRW